MGRKVVYNRCYGGFSLSLEAFRALKNLKELNGQTLPGGEYEYGKSAWLPDSFPRHDPDLVFVVEDMGAAASGECGQLEVKDIGDDLYRIEEHDGKERVETLPRACSEWI